ncbi:3-oxoacyl-ACP synthase III family protein [Cryobacterium sp. TMT4-10]|uniref:3-oxoacyl-ACP synthase III family protein n=1 Tax=Cryobacterium sp. TMT4-10 TaxID=1259256 RepID=UPI00106B2D25|nr:ketoacyl-ACP synthase III [Cryobacterium sp. TMT4-10]TFD11985.1 ketoacyl-ACP synthase III [Cryobacterium sp. TMT4-10]
MPAKISCVSYFLPTGTLTNEDLTRDFPEWSVDKIAKKTGINTRHIAAADEFASDLAVGAGAALFDEHAIDRASVDYLIVCTQSPDYFLPTTACVVQDRLGLDTRVGAIDVNLGCSGYIYSLGLAKGLIESGQADRVMIITADTYSKFINADNKSVRTIFGDGASATLVSSDGVPASLQAITYGTDGSGARHLMVPHGGLRTGAVGHDAALTGDQTSNGYDLFMDGPEIFNFTIRVVPSSVDRILDKAGLAKGDIDLFVFHQANSFMLEHLRKKLEIDENRFFVSMETTGNTVSSSIPIALAEAVRQGALRDGMRVLLLGFGVGLSWGGLILEW